MYNFVFGFTGGGGDLWCVRKYQPPVDASRTCGGRVIILLPFNLMVRHKIAFSLNIFKSFRFTRKRFIDDNHYIRNRYPVGSYILRVRRDN